MKILLNTLLTVVFTGVILAQNPQTHMEARQALQAAVTKLRNAEAAGEAKAIGEARFRMRVAEAGYMQAARTVHTKATRGMSRDNKVMYTYRQIPELNIRRSEFENSLHSNAEQMRNVNSSDDKYRAAMASNEATLRMKMLDDQVNNRIAESYRKTETRSERKSTVHDRVVTAKVKRMDELMTSIEGNDYNSSYKKKSAEVEMDKMIKRVKYDRDMQEFRKLANTDDWKDPRTGKLLPELVQRKARANAMQALEQRVKKRSHDGGIPETFVNFFSGEKKDSRLSTARQLMGERVNDVETQALKHLEGKNATPQEYYRAMANSIHKKKGTLEDWYSNEYLPKSNDGKDNVVKQWANLGMGTAKRSIMSNSEDGVTTVRRKIDAALAKGDEAAAALSAAASMPVSRLTPKQRDLLVNYEMLKKGDDDQFHYVVPSKTRKLNTVTDVDLPKNPWMDVVSVKSTAVTGLSIVTGSGAASAAQKLSQLGGMTERGAAALSVIAEVGASSAMDSAINMAEGRKANFDQALLQNLTMSGLGKVTKGVGDEFLNRNTPWKEAMKDKGGRSMFRELAGKTKDGEKILRSNQMKRFIAEAAGVTTDASIETLYQAAASGGPVDRDAFMANLFQGAMSKTASNVMKDTGGKIKEGSGILKDKLIARLPDGVKQWAIDHPKAVAESFIRARKSEAHGKAAINRFEAVKKKADGGGFFDLKKRRRSDAELLNDPEFANHVVDSLKKGEMRWSDLGIIAEKKGSSVSELLHAVKDKRTKWAYGVGDPSKDATTARAKDNLKKNLQKNVDEIQNGSGTPGEKASRTEALNNDFHKTVEALGSKSDTAEGRAAKKALGDAGGQLFNEAVMKDGIGAEVKDRAKLEAKREFDRKRDDIKKQHFFGKGADAISESQMKDRLKVVGTEESGVLNRIDQAKMIAPGSGDPTSDIDRSWSEPRVMQAMKGLQRDRLMLDREGVKGVGPTTAKAWDLNEYYNVMDGVKAAMPLRNHKEKGFANEKVIVDGVGTMSHDDAVAGNGRAAAMTPMSPENRALYKENALREAHGDPAKSEMVKREFEVADKELAASKERIDAARIKVAKKFGLDPNSHEAEIYARDKVYGESMRKVKALDQEIAGLTEGSAEWKQKQSLRERMMNTASRDGIEAYTDAAGLEVIVNRMQQNRNENGSKKTVASLWADDKFNRNGDLKEFSERQLDNMMNDQVMMVSEHLNAFRDGHETSYQTARALAKYGQRAALVAKMNGKDLPPGHPLRALFDATSTLMEHKGDPAEMMKALKKLAGPGGSARDGLKKLVSMSEKAVPGLEGYTGVKPKPLTTQDGKPAPGSIPQGFSSLSSYKDWLRERDARYEDGGQPAVDRWLNNQEEGAKFQKKLLIEEKKELKDLGKKYLPEDFRSARRLEENYDTLLQELASIPVSNTPSDRYIEILKEMGNIERSLNALKAKRDAYIKEHGEEPTNPDLEAIDRELAHLIEQRKMLNEAIKNHTHPPVIGPPTADEDSVDDLFKDEEELGVDKKKGGGGIIPALEDAFKEIK